MNSWVSLVISILAIILSGATFIFYRREFHSRLRPWVGVCNWNSDYPVSFSSDGEQYEAGITITNFGSLPALDLSIECTIEGETLATTVVQRQGWIIWPGQKETMEWSILPPIAKTLKVKTTIIIRYKLPFYNNNYAETREIRDYWTNSRYFNDSPNKQSLAT